MVKETLVFERSNFDAETIVNSLIAASWWRTAVAFAIVTAKFESHESKGNLAENS